MILVYPRAAGRIDSQYYRVLQGLRVDCGLVFRVAFGFGCSEFAVVSFSLVVGRAACAVVSFHLPRLVLVGPVEIWPTSARVAFK